MYIPIVVTSTRILLTPVIVCAILAHHLALAWSLFSFACLTDFLDGLLARKLHQSSALGAFLDALADKILVITILFVLTATHTFSPFNITPVLFIVWREIFVASIRHIKITKPVSGGFLCKIKTSLQMLSLFLLLGKSLYPVLHTPAFVSLWITGIFTIISIKAHIKKIFSL